MPMSTSPPPMRAPQPEELPPAEKPSAYGFSFGPHGELLNEPAPCEKLRKVSAAASRGA